MGAALNAALVPIYDSIAAIIDLSEIVAELNRFIVGQEDAKKAVAIALRNHWRRQQVEEPLREEIVPKNILMIYT